MVRESKAMKAQRLRLQSEYLIQQEKLREEHNPMSHLKLAIVRTQHKAGFNVEFHIEEPSADGVNQMIAALMQEGYSPVKSSGARPDAVDNNGKLATVESITKIEGKNQWRVKAIIDGTGNGSQEFIVFNDGAFIPGDRIRLNRNDKGYYSGTRAIGAPSNNGTTDIPF